MIIRTFITNTNFLSMKRTHPEKISSPTFALNVSHLAANLHSYTVTILPLSRNLVELTRVHLFPPSASNNSNIGDASYSPLPPSHPPSSPFLLKLYKQSAVSSNLPLASRRYAQRFFLPLRLPGTNTRSTCVRRKNSRV